MKLFLVFLFFVLIFNIVPKFAYIYILAGTKKINMGEYEEGLKLFCKGASSDKVKPFTKIRYAFLELKFGSLDKAKKVLSLIINDKKTDRDTKFEAKAVYALIAFKEGNINEAKELMLEVYENHKTTNMYCTLGYLFNIMESPGKAVEFNSEAYAYNSEHNVILDNLGQSYYLNNDNNKAIKIYELLISKNPEFPEAYYNYALVLIKDNKSDKADEMLRKALSMPFNNLTTVTKNEIEDKLINKETEI